MVQTLRLTSACILHVSLASAQDQHESKTFSTPARYSTAKTALEQELRRSRGPISIFLRHQFPSLHSQPPQNFKVTYVSALQLTSGLAQLEFC